MVILRVLTNLYLNNVCIRKKGARGTTKREHWQSREDLGGTWTHHRSTWTDQRDFWDDQKDAQADQRVMGPCEEHLDQQETLGLSRGALVMMRGALNPTRGTLDANHRGT